jgi:hypothetical protein
VFLRGLHQAPRVFRIEHVLAALLVDQPQTRELAALGKSRKKSAELLDLMQKFPVLMSGHDGSSLNYPPYQGLF